MIGPILRLAAASAAGRAIRGAAADISQRAALALAAVVAGTVGLFCFSNAALTVMERSLDPAEAWCVLGAFYGVIGCVLYFVATRRR